MKWYYIGTVLIILLVGTYTKSILVTPNDVFDIYFLPLFFGKYLTNSNQNKIPQNLLDLGDETYA